jgi:hypothetical protein
MRKNELLKEAIGDSYKRRRLVAVVGGGYQRRLMKMSSGCQQLGLGQPIEPLTWAFD